jgi:hypothetical protein
LACHLLAKYGEFKQLVSFKVDPTNYVDAQSFFLDYQSAQLLSKYPYLPTGINTQAVAREKFHQAEQSCRETNARFRESEVRPFEADVEEILVIARRKIASILGDVPNLEDLDFSFGPGAAYGVRGDTSVFNKVAATLECTYAFSSILPDFLSEFPGWINTGTIDVDLIEGSELTFVPKNAKTDRAICIEPLLNGLYQKGFGSWIRDLLKKHGIDLRDQRVNARLAGVAHVEGLATVDFASASDTISYLLVLDLLPLPWFEALDVARAPRYKDDGVWKSFQKFSSMGNAYTFELESLIFYALAYACMQYQGFRPKTGVNLSVYGDDVIIPQASFDLFARVSEVCGFTVNEDKSFKSGLFFESCGHDFFNGTPVRPILLKEKIDGLKTYYAINTLARISRRIPSPSCRDYWATSSFRRKRAACRENLRACHARLVDRLPRHFRVAGPEGYGDGHLIANTDEFIGGHPRLHRVFDGFVFSTYLERAVVNKIARKDAVEVGPNQFPFSTRGYALYYVRVEKSPPPRAIYGVTEIPRADDNGLGYAVRGKTHIKRVESLCFHEHWPNMSIVDGWYDSLGQAKEEALRLENAEVTG